MWCFCVLYLPSRGCLYYFGLTGDRSRQGAGLPGPATPPTSLIPFPPRLLNSLYRPSPTPGLSDTDFRVDRPGGQRLIWPWLIHAPILPVFWTVTTPVARLSVFCVLASAPTLKAASCSPRQARSPSPTSSSFPTCRPFLSRQFAYPVTSDFSNDDGAAVSCPSRHTATSWSTPRSRHGSRPTSKCCASRRCYDAPSSSRSVGTWRTSGYAGWINDGRNASRSWDDWTWGPGPECPRSFPSGSSASASVSATTICPEL